MLGLFVEVAVELGVDGYQLFGRSLIVIEVFISASGISSSSVSMSPRWATETPTLPT
jgi:hypothetical protein